MSSIPKQVLGVLLILMGIAGVSGCASKDAEISSLKRLLAAQQERIEALQLSKADMRRVIGLKNADLARAKKARLRAERERGLPSVAAWSHGTSVERGGTVVRQVQHALKQLYYYHGPLDGVYSPQTRRAIAAYQRAKGLAIGDMTFETLRSLGLKTPDQRFTTDVR